MDLVSMTAMAEYVDMLYSRLAIEVAKHEEVTRWWVELHPPNMSDGEYLNEEDRGTVGYVKLKAFAPPKQISYRADFRAAQRGARAGTNVLEQVVEHHVSQFISTLTATA